MTSDSRQNAIQELAYAKWEQAGWPSGDGLQFWLEAEQEVLTECSHNQTDCDSAQDPSTSRKSASAAFAPINPPPLKLPKSGQTRKKAG